MNHPLFRALLLAAFASLASCASNPETPRTTTYDKQVNQQAQEDFDRTLNPSY